MNQRVTTIIDILKLKSTPTAILFQVNQITKFQIPNINAATAWMLVFTSLGMLSTHSVQYMQNDMNNFI